LVDHQGRQDLPADDLRLVLRLKDRLHVRLVVIVPMNRLATTLPQFRRRRVMRRPRQHHRPHHAIHLPHRRQGRRVRKSVNQSTVLR